MKYYDSNGVSPTLRQKNKVAGLTDLSMVLAKDGKSYGEYALRGGRRNPGVYSIVRIFEEPGVYMATFPFRRGEDAAPESITLELEITDRTSAIVRAN